MHEEINLINMRLDSCVNLFSHMLPRQSSSFVSQEEMLNPGILFSAGRSKQKNNLSDQYEEISLLTLHQAARDGQINMVKEYLSSYGKDRKKINMKDAEQTSALHYAVRYGHFHIVKLLVESGANINIKGEYGATPLHYASRYIVEKKKNSQLSNEQVSLPNLQKYSKPIRQIMNFGKSDSKKSLTKSIKTVFETGKKKNQNKKKTIHCSLEGINNLFGKKPHLNTVKKDSSAITNRTHSNFDLIGNLNSENSFHYGYEDNQIESESKRPVVIIGELSKEELVEMKSVDALILPALKNVSSSDTIIESSSLNEKFNELGEKPFGTVNEFTDFLKEKFSKKKPDVFRRKPPYNRIEEDSILMYLLEQKAYVNAKDFYGSTPLHYAAMRGNIIATKRLLKQRNIEIEAIDRTRITPLHCAASAGSFAVCRLLLEHGANIFCQDEEDMTPLHFAAMEGHLDIVMLLFDYAEKQGGVTMLAKLIFSHDRDEQTALHLAVESNHINIVEFCIKKGANVNLMKANMTSPLHLASTSGLVEIAKLLVENGADIEAKNSLQETPLHRAALFNRAEIVEYLLSKGASINSRDKDNETPLLMAVRKNNLETVKLLLEHSADLTVKDANDKTCLFIAAEENSIEAFEILCEHNIKTLLEEFDKHEMTPLHIAAKEGHETIVQTLLNLGACIDAKNDENLTPLHLASKYGHFRIVEIFLSNDLSIVKDVDDASNTPLHLAATEGHVKVVEILIKSGAAVDARNALLWTPLDCAAFRGWKHCAEFLLDADSLINPIDKFKITPLHLASKEGHVEMVKLLLSRNADISRKDHLGRNCLDYAIDNNQREAAIVIVSSDKWKIVMRNSTFEGNKHTTPMRKLIKKLPDVAEIVFNQCIVDNGLPNEHPQFKLTCTYEFLEDVFTPWGPNSIEFFEHHSKALIVPAFQSSFTTRLAQKMKLPGYCLKNMEIKQNHPLKFMVQNERTRLLCHPLVTYLLGRKWNSSGRYVYYSRLLLYIIFLVFVTAYALSLHKELGPVGCCLNCSTDATSNFTKINPAVASTSSNFFIKPGRYFIVVLSAISLTIEMMKLLFEVHHYLHIHRLMELVVYIFALYFALESFRWTRDEYRCSEWYRGFGAATVTLSWLVLVLFLRKFPKLGIYVVMFTHILKTFAKFSIVFILFIIAFGLGFHLALNEETDDTKAFTTPARSMLKTTLGMLGEFEYDTVFNKATVEQIPIGWAVYVTYLIINCIILMNLLVGLAVDDIKGVQKQAALQRLAMVVDLTLDVEKALPISMQKKLVKLEESFYPNANKTWSVWSCWSSEPPATNTNEKIDNNLKKKEHNELRETVNNLQARMKAMEAQNNRMEDMLNGIVKHLNIIFGRYSMNATPHNPMDETFQIPVHASTHNYVTTSSFNPVNAISHQMQLLQVQVVFRHGARTPTNDSKYNDIPNAELYLWDKSELMATLPHVDIEYRVQLPDGNKRPLSAIDESYKEKDPFKGGCLAGQLTIIGQQHAYMLGKRLGNEYIEKHKLLSMYSSKDVYVRSSNIDRTILSAKCVLAGMFSKDHFKEVPVIITNELKDEILYPNFYSCAYLRKWYDHVKENFFTVLGHAKDYEHINKVLGCLDADINFIALNDFVVCRKAHCGSIPIHLMPEEFMISKRAAELQAYLITSNNRLCGLRSSVGALVDLLCSRISDSENSQKLYLYSAHDTTIIALLLAFDLWDEMWPEFSSNIAFEVYINEVGEKFVRVLYNRSAMNLKIDGHNEYYPLNKFLALLECFRVKDWREECGNDAI